ncbi:unnamed protein product [Xylocopa violacea]|uniref:Uncharacterized protein n=1 Tax=Xylocopa violacea TaxID=135666 RepID=A0ABP1NLB7_XYLVO
MECACAKIGICLATSMNSLSLAPYFLFSFKKTIKYLTKPEAEIGGNSVSIERIKNNISIIFIKFKLTECENKSGRHRKRARNKEQARESLYDVTRWIPIFAHAHSTLGFTDIKSADREFRYCMYTVIKHYIKGIESTHVRLFLVPCEVLHRTVISNKRRHLAYLMYSV